MNDPNILWRGKANLRFSKPTPGRPTRYGHQPRLYALTQAIAANVPPPSPTTMK